MTRWLTGLALAALAAFGARADTYPSRPITIVVPFPAGGSTGVLARILADPMQAVLGQSIIIENVGGADIAASATAVLDDHLLTQVLGHARSDETRHHVGRAAGRERHHERDGPARVLALRPGQCRHPAGEHR